MNKVAALVLAAGKASRFRAAAGASGPVTKLVALYAGKPLVRHVAQAALASGTASVIVVTGHAQDVVTEALAGLPVQYVHNGDYETGLASSLKAGVATLDGDVSGVVILLADMPRVSARIITRLVNAFADHPDARAVVPVVGGQRGNPVLIARALFAEVARLSGDVGARPLLQAAGEGIVEVDVADEAVTFDVDTPDALGDSGQK